MGNLERVYLKIRLLKKKKNKFMCLSEYKIIKKVSLCVYLSICYTYMFRCSQASEKTEISMLKLQAL